LRATSQSATSQSATSQSATSQLPKEYNDFLEDFAEEYLKIIYENKGGNIFDNQDKIIEQGKIFSNVIVKDFTTPDYLTIANLQKNVWQFSCAKNYQELKDLSLALVDDNGKIRSFSDFVEKATKITVKQNGWLQTEYNQAIIGAESASRWSEMENDNAVVNLIYRTVGDSYVRDEHQLLDGVVRPKNDAWWNINYPPNGWGCRCAAEADFFSQITPTNQLPNVTIPPMFRQNLAKAGLIFPKGHPYFKDIPRKELDLALKYIPIENAFYKQKLKDGDTVIGKILISAMVDKKELIKGIDASKIFLKHQKDAKIELLPKIEVQKNTKERDIEFRKKTFGEEYLKKFPLKNPDLRLNGEFADFKIVSGSYSSVQKAIKDGKKQAKIILIKVPNESNFDYIIQAVNGQFNKFENTTDLVMQNK